VVILDRAWLNDMAAGTHEPRQTAHYR
jgi:hypothetical protein